MKMSPLSPSQTVAPGTQEHSPQLQNLLRNAEGQERELKKKRVQVIEKDLTDVSDERFQKKLESLKAKEKSLLLRVKRN